MERLGNRSRVVFFCAAFLGIFSSTMVQAEAPAPDKLFAVISKLDGTGTAKVKRKSGAQSVAGEKQQLFPGDLVETDAASVVEIVLNDGSLIRVGKNSAYQIESVEKHNGLLSWAFQLVKGSIRAVVEKSPDKKTVKFRVNTPVGTMGVRGTEFVINYDQKAGVMRLFTLEGLVFFGPKACDKSKKCIDVKAGEHSEISRGSNKPLPAVLFKPEEVLGLRGGSGKKDEAVAKAAPAAASVATRTEQANDLDLFEDLKDADARGPAPEVKDAGLMLKMASEKMRAAQDKMLNRTKEQRDAMSAAIVDGTFNAKIKLAEEFDDAVTGGARKASREKERMGGVTTAQKFQLGEGLAAAGKISKGNLEKVLDANATLLRSAGASNLKSADVDVDAILKKVNGKIAETQQAVRAIQEQNQVVAQTPVSTASATSTSTGIATATSITVTGPTSGPTTSAQPIEIILSSYSSSYSKRFEYYDECGNWFPIICDDKKVGGEWGEKEDTYKTQNVNTVVKKVGNSCYKTVKECGKSLVPCDLSLGRFCTPTFVDKCNTNTVAIPCPNGGPTSSGDSRSR